MSKHILLPRRGPHMFKAIVVLFLSSCAFELCYAAAGDFKTDIPSPLRLAHPRATQAVAFKFSGRIRLSGRFLVVWREGKQERYNLFVAFFPDADSAARLPRMNIDLPVKELRFSNPEQAVSILLDPSPARMLLAREQLSATGNVTATIQQYTVTVACDRRWYDAKLMTVSMREKVVLGGREKLPKACQ